MVRKSLIVKNNKIKSIVDRNFSKRQEMKKKVRDLSLSPKERFAVQLKLDARKRKESPVQFVKRCNITGRGTGYIGLFGVSRLVFRELAFKGYIPGLTKDSW